jgi:ABC-type transport system involved in multi-copper enzyme maturation permease subunit
MPIYDKGYRRWQGELRGRFYRWFTIARAGIRQSGKGKWLRRFILIAWMPLLYYGLVFFVVGQLTTVESMEKAQSMWQFQVLRGMFSRPLIESFIADPASFRLTIWSILIHFFMHYTQIFCVMIVVAIVGPKLISEDIKTRALSVYFSRPLTRVDYVVGKLAVVSFWVGAVTLLPSLALYFLSIAFSPGFDTLAQTLIIVPKIVTYSLLLMLGCGLVMLALSSMIRNPRFLGFAWAGFWVMTSVASNMLSQALFPRIGSSSEASVKGDWTGMLSFSANFDAVGLRLFNIEALAEPAAQQDEKVRELLNRLTYGHDWGWSLLIVAGLAVISAFVIFHRIGKAEEG